MHSFRKTLPRIAAILFFLVLANIVAPKDSIGLPHPQSPILPDAAYLPLAIRGTTHHPPAVYLPLVIKEGVLPAITPGKDPYGSISGAIWIWENGTWTMPQGLITIECWDGVPGGGTLISTTYSEDGYYLLENIPPGTNYWVRGYVQVDSVWYAEMYSSPVTVRSGQETQHIDPLLMPLFYQMRVRKV